MSTTEFERYFKDVPDDQRAFFLSFLDSHPVKDLDFRGNKWEYRIGGSGEGTIVLLTGGGSNAEIWFKIIAEFEKHYRMVAPRYPPVMTMKELIGGLETVMNRENIKQAHLIGLSLGGMLAQCFVRRYPERVTSLILSSTAGPDKHVTGHMKREEFLMRLAPFSLLRPVAKHQLSKHAAAVPIEERAFWLAFMNAVIATSINKADIVSLYKVIADYDEHYFFSPTDLAHWHSAILILQADDDKLLTRLAKEPLTFFYPGASTYTFHGSGHLIMVTKREEFIGLVGNFLLNKSTCICNTGNFSPPSNSC